MSAPTVVGRDAQSGIRLDRDEFASSRHARIEPRPERRLGRRPRLDERHVRERLEAEEGTDREGRRRHQDRRDRAAGAGMRIGRATAVTDTGRRRMRNEDAFVFEPPLFAIADGMGGARAGEIAAGIAAAALKEQPQTRSRTRTASRPSSTRRTAASGSARSRTRARPAWARRSPSRSSTPRRTASSSARSATRAPIGFAGTRSSR